MFKDKQGVSMIVSTMIIILLVIVAVGIVWFVARGTLEGGSEQFALGAKCLSVDLESSANCKAVVDATYDGNCTARLERKPGGDAIGGVKLIFTSVDGGENFIEDVPGDIGEFEIKSIGTNAVPINVSFDSVETYGNVSKMEVMAYFLDESGNQQLCSGATSTVNF